MNPQDSEVLEEAGPPAAPPGGAKGGAPGELATDSLPRSGLPFVSETEPLAPGVQYQRDRQLQVAAALWLCGAVSGTYCWSYLLPAFEQDVYLDWTPAATSKLSTLAQAMETTGLFLAGPLADHLPARTLLVLEVVVMSLSMLAMSMTYSTTVIPFILVPSQFMKGILWPTVGSTISANVSTQRQDETFLISALGARIGDVLGTLVLGFLMDVAGLTWRHALTVFLLMILSLIFLAGWQSPRHIAEPADSMPSICGQLEKWLRMISSVDGWLALFTLVGCYFGWTLEEYLSVILQDMYLLTPGRAAAAVSSINIGMVMGLLSCLLCSMCLSQDGLRIQMVLQASLGVGALALLATWPAAPLVVAFFFLGVVGFGFAVPAHVPYLVYASHSTPTDRAFRLATLDGSASCVSIFLAYAYGRLREKGLSGPELYGITCGGFSISVIATAVLFWRETNSLVGSPRGEPGAEVEKRSPQPADTAASYSSSRGSRCV
jgi:MFS family permease